MKTYRSKISWLLFASIYLVLIITAFIIALDNVWLALLIIVPVIVLVTSLLMSTQYTIVDDKLLNIKSGFFFRKSIEIVQIKKIKDTSSILSSPATSFKNRIELSFNKFDTIIISPEEKDAFVAHLLQINPDIQVKA